ncbi:hypothetical protein [Burkholderia sp. Ac-20379]|uniref:hypothetical protein n=1 Tax=Burkholderia sp. Ac-20379 TaxID=2703900 RepID=UPI0019820345|nr:hypothetical protein [Burkholderia sp. Ac-20379]MBN3723014.1 hypothetical protein [Burkholderia sp. Ac-20379]
MMRKPGIAAAACALLAFASSAHAADGAPQAPSQPVSAARQGGERNGAEPSGYGAQPRMTAEAGKRAQDPFTINGRSMYDVH